MRAKLPPAVAGKRSHSDFKGAKPLFYHSAVPQRLVQKLIGPTRSPSLRILSPARIVFITAWEAGCRSYHLSGAERRAKSRTRVAHAQRPSRS
jgi:hypothetical protein